MRSFVATALCRRAWMEQRHESALTQRGGYNTYGTHPWFVIAGTSGTPAAALASTGDLGYTAYPFQKRLDQTWRNIYKRRFPAS
jgi:hypothetical protein